MHTAALAEIGALVGDPGRANMLTALLEGRALTARELADCAGVTPQTAAGHLAKLAAASLITVQAQGRHRYHRLASPEVARMLEAMMAAAGVGQPLRPPRTGPKEAALRNARTCYDHLAGRLGVGLADSLTERGCLHLDRDAGELTDQGRAFLTSLGVTSPPEGRTRRQLCRLCLDWSERRPHLAGALGAALMQRLFDLHWIRRIEGSRAVSVSVEGEAGLRRIFGLTGLRPVGADYG